MLNQKVQNVELNIVDPSHVSLKQRIEEKGGGNICLEIVPDKTIYHVAVCF